MCEWEVMGERERKEEMRWMRKQKESIYLTCYLLHSLGKTSCVSLWIYIIFSDIDHTLSEKKSSHQSVLCL